MICQGDMNELIHQFHFCQTGINMLARARSEAARAPFLPPTLANIAVLEVKIIEGGNNRAEMSYKMTNILTVICFVSSANPNKDGNKRDAKVGEEVEEEGGEGVEGQEDGEAADKVGQALGM